MRSSLVTLSLALWSIDVIPVSAEALLEKIAEALPRYDPSVHEAAVTKEEAARQLGTSEPPTQPAAIPDAPGIPTANISPVELPEVVVTTEQPKPDRPKALPRVETRPAQGKARLEPFLTPEEKVTRLEEKHLSVLDRKVLNRMALFRYGFSKADRAREAEAIERGARGLNEVASQIENASAAGADDEYLRNLEKIYYQMYLARPK